MLQRIVILLLLLTPLYGCSASNEWPEQKGKVIDESTGKGIPGVIVVALWDGSAAFSHTVCFHVESTTTNANGEYRIPSFRNGMGNLFLDHKGVTTRFYRLGYEETLPPTDAQKSFEAGIYYMKPFAGTDNDRFEFLVQLNASCGQAGISRRNLYSFYFAQYQEARVLAITPEQKSYVDRLRRLVAGYAIATNEESLTHDETEKRIDQYLDEHPL